jgi:starch synthase
LKAGVLYADKLTTVSKSYTEELMQSSLNYGLEGLLSLRGDLVTGIANGIDMDEYNPLDKILPFPYDKTSMSEKKKNRTFLRNEYGLADKDIPLIAMVSRLDAQKGIELLLSVIHQMDLTSFQMIIVGSGNDYYQDMLMSLSELYPESIVYDEKYSSSLAKLVYAASDIYLMPSKQEPCGLGQLYAMRYGSVPVVNPVGGLKDTVIEDPEHIEKSYGFTLEDWNQTALKEALERAIMAYQEENWPVIMKNCMKRDSSWKKSIAEYKKLYNDILADKNN